MKDKGLTLSHKQVLEFWFEMHGTEPDTVETFVLVSCGKKFWEPASIEAWIEDLAFLEYVPW